LFDVESDCFIGIDYGATHIRAGLVDGSGAIRQRVKKLVPADTEARLAAPLQLARELASGARAVGLAIAGTVGHGVLTWTSNLGLGKVAYARLLTEATGLDAIVVNDARAAGYAEVIVGSATEGQVVLYISVGSGIGGAVVINRKLIEGTGYAGEVGHMVIDPRGPRCRCGRSGCWEKLASGMALDRYAEEHACTYPNGLVAVAANQRPPSARDLISAAGEGDRAATDAVQTVARAFATGLDNLAAALAPDVVVLGGGIMSRPGSLRHLYLDAIHNLRWLRGEVKLAALGDDGGIIGAALLSAELLATDAN
jgi:glucokinase